MAAAAGSSIYLPESVTLLGVEQPTELEKVFRVKFDSGRPLGHGPGQLSRSLFGIGEAPISICSSSRGLLRDDRPQWGMLTNECTTDAGGQVRCATRWHHLPIDEMEVMTSSSWPAASASALRSPILP